MEKVKIKVKRITTIHKTISTNVQPVIIILDTDNEYYHYYSIDKVNRNLEILALAEVDDIIELKYQLIEGGFSNEKTQQRKIYEVYSCKPDVQ